MLGDTCLSQLSWKHSAATPKPHGLKPATQPLRHPVLHPNAGVEQAGCFWRHLWSVHSGLRGETESSRRAFSVAEEGKGLLRKEQPRALSL